MSLAPQIINVEVTSEDIEQGQRLNLRSCPVARAMTRATGQTVSVSGAGAWLYAKHNDKQVMAVYQFPNHVVSNIIDFDNGKDMTPMSFTATLKGEV